jgi:acyl-CoA reductase-like NAD-dependent aldehyde dehydrogenase
VREPIGVVACITPSNFPMTNCAGKIGPALACGNTVVVKPAPPDPLGVAELCRIANEILPPGVINFVCGAGPEVGEALVASDDVDMISFTGSTGVGFKIQETAAKRLKRTLMELGGKSPQIVFADAPREAALKGATQVWTFHTARSASRARGSSSSARSTTSSRSRWSRSRAGSRSAIRASRAPSSGRSSPRRSATASSSSSRRA